MRHSCFARGSLATIVFALMLGPALPHAQSGSPDELAAKVQQRYDSIRDFEASFVQSYEGGLLRTRTTESGTVAIKRPGRMRWVYTKPERKEFVSNGQRIYSYLPADKQVIVAAMPSGEQTTPALFLSGRGHLVRDFTASFAPLPGAPADLVGLKLVPKRNDPEVEWLLLGVDPGTFQIRQLIAADKQGGRSSFQFSNLKENRNLSDKLFEFQVPRGVEVVTSGVPAK
jgi:outer membrane lipoprotein carrier protein